MWDPTNTDFRFIDDGRGLWVHDDHTLAAPPLFATAPTPSLHALDKHALELPHTNPDHFRPIAAARVFNGTRLLNSDEWQIPNDRFGSIDNDTFPVHNRWPNKRGSCCDNCAKDLRPGGPCALANRTAGRTPHPAHLASTDSELHAVPRFPTDTGVSFEIDTAHPTNPYTPSKVYQATLGWPECPHGDSSKPSWHQNSALSEDPLPWQNPFPDNLVMVVSSWFLQPVTTKRTKSGSMCRQRKCPPFEVPCGRCDAAFTVIGNQSQKSKSGRVSFDLKVEEDQEDFAMGRGLQPKRGRPGLCCEPEDGGQCKATIPCCYTISMKILNNTPWSLPYTGCDDKLRGFRIPPYSYIVINETLQLVCDMRTQCRYGVYNARGGWLQLIIRFHCGECPKKRQPD